MGPLECTRQSSDSLRVIAGLQQVNFFFVQTICPSISYRGHSVKHLASNNNAGR